MWETVFENGTMHYARRKFCFTSSAAPLCGVPHCEITTSDVLVSADKVDVGMNGRLKVNGYVTTTLTLHPGLFTPLAVVQAAPEGVVPGHVVVAVTDAAVMPGGTMLCT